MMRVVVVGAPCCGKSQLVRGLHRFLKGMGVRSRVYEECARVRLEAGKPLNTLQDEFDLIEECVCQELAAYGEDALHIFESGTIASSVYLRMLARDTEDRDELADTYVALLRVDGVANVYYRRQLVVLVDELLPFEDDGVRQPWLAQMREDVLYEMQQNVEIFCEYHDIPLVRVRGSTEERVECVYNALTRFFGDEFDRLQDARMVVA